MVEFIDRTSTEAGTPLNRAHMMALQDFAPKTTVFNADGSITETNSEGHTKTTVFDNVNKKVTETFVGEKTIVKTTYFEGNTIREVIGV